MTFRHEDCLHVVVSLTVFLVRFEVVMAVIRVMIIWFLVPCGLVGRSQGFGKNIAFCFQLESWRWRQHDSSKRCPFPTSLQGVKNQKNVVVRDFRRDDNQKVALCVSEIFNPLCTSSAYQNDKRNACEYGSGKSSLQNQSSLLYLEISDVSAYLLCLAFEIMAVISYHCSKCTSVSFKLSHLCIPTKEMYVRHLFTQIFVFTRHYSWNGLILSTDTATRYRQFLWFIWTFHFIPYMK